MINRILLHFILLSSLYFYNIGFLGPLPNYLNLFSSLLIIGFIIVNIVYGGFINCKMHFAVPIFLIFIGVILSTISASIFHDQKITSSLLAQKEMYLYFGYFLLHLIRPSPKEIERIIIIYLIVFLVFYLIQYLAYPNELFNINMQEDRGTIRIALPGVIFIVIGYYFILQLFMRTNKLMYVLLCMVILVMAILLGGRQLISILLFTTLLNLILSRRIKNRGIIFTISILSLIPLYFIFHSIIIELFEVTQESINAGSNDVRIRAARFFLLDSFPNGISYITGNGEPSLDSAYGRYMDTIAFRYRFFLSDIGIVGNYYIYGFFFALGVLLIFLKVFRLKINKNEDYLKYFFFAILLMLPMGGGFAYGEFILPLTMLLYLIDISNKARIEELNHSH